MVINIFNIKYLYYIIYLYITIPLTIFVLGWLNIVIGLGMSLILLLPLFICFKNKYIKVNKTDIFKICISIIIVIILLILSGVGGFGFQNSDYNKHNAILRDLIKYNFPVIYENGGLLVYYLAYYLPSALIGKLFGFHSANIFLFMWSLIGLVLFLLMFYIYFEKVKIAHTIIFIFFSGLDIVGYIICIGIPEGTQHIEHWVNILSYQSNITQLFWVPQHAIGGWLFTILILNLIKEKNKYVIFIYSISIFWSPFIFIGLFPFILYYFFKNIKLNFNLCNYMSFIIVFIFGMYYRRNAISGSAKLLFKSNNIYDFWFLIFLFYILEFLIYVFILSEELKKDNIFLISVITLSLLPLVQFGLYGDLVMRASIPSLCVLCFSVIKYIDRNLHYKKLLIMLLIIGSVTGIFEISRSIKNFKTTSDVWISVSVAQNKIEAAQYISYNYKNSKYYKYIMKN